MPLADPTAAAARLSSPNLVRNAGFAHDAESSAFSWAGTDGRLPPRVPVPDFDAAGRPFSSHAVRLGGAIPSVSQDILLPGHASARFALRVTARGDGPDSIFTLTVKRHTADGHDAVEHECRFTVGPSWQRCRTGFQLPNLERSDRVSVVISAAPGCSLAATDVRFVAVNPPPPTFAIRFDTRGTMVLPSTRLRAVMIEDYLHLLGWQTTIGSGSDHDLLVCQKVTPWRQLLAARLRGAAVVFDLDDNEQAQGLGRAARIGLFSNLADGTTAGATYLQERLSRTEAPALLFDNIVDVLDPDIAHDGSRWNGRIVWFGMPENAWMVDALALDLPVTRITRGGDIEYGVKSIDSNLVRYDLALLPVTLTEHTKAKNANRLVKCVGLGLPFLASDTPEHRRAADKLNLPDRFFVAEGEDWSARIAAVKADYAAFKSDVDAARIRAFDVYGIERIAADWLAYCSALVERRRPARSPTGGSVAKHHI